jgi:bifunctional non-homologous end joining protein LigD
MGRRSGAWIKVKHRQRRELVIGGWVEGEGRRGGLPLGYCDGDRFIYAGRCGTGFTHGMLPKDHPPRRPGGPRPPAQACR